MVKKYIILANSNDNKCGIPRQLIKINGEPIIKRTIRLLKENGIEDIIVLAKDKRFDKLGVDKYVPINNTYNYKTEKGYFLDMFPLELIDEPVCFIWGDVYFSEDAIKTIVKTDTDSTLFFCSYNNTSKRYIKEYDEPFAYKVVDKDLFVKHINIVKKMYDDGLTNRHPIVWELYRSINGIDVNEHIMTNNYVAINDETCDIDYEDEIKRLKLKVENNVSKKLSLVIPYYKCYEYTIKLLDILIPQLNNDVEVILIDDGCNETRLNDFIYQDKFKDQWNNIHIYHSLENHGGGYTCNMGIDSASGQYIGFIDADDYVSNDYVETLLDAIDNKPADVIYMDWQDTYTGEVITRPDNYAPWKAIYNREIIPRFCASHKYHFDVAFYDELKRRGFTRSDTDKLLYFYNSKREGNLSDINEKERKQNI